MSNVEAQPAEQWPPLELITELELDKKSKPEEQLDPNVVKVLPSGIQISGITTSGSSAWVETVRIDTRLPDGRSRSYFKKSQKGEVGRRMMQGTFESEKAFWEYAPRNVPKPVAWDAYQNESDIYFYLAEFHDMVARVPDPQRFVQIIAKVHQESKGKAPSGKFGFHVPTHLGNIPNDNAWEDTWEAFFTKAMRKMVDLEEASQGSSDEEFESLKAQLFSKVIPRLLRPLETGGRSVIPCLVHSDLWPGNCMPDLSTDEIIIFDSCAFWGHNEADLGSWRASRYHMGRPFLEAYRKLIEPDFPQDEWEDRNVLYALRYDFLVSTMFPNTKKFRNEAKKAMKRIVEKYPNGFDEWQESTK